MAILINTGIQIKTIEELYNLLKTEWLLRYPDIVELPGTLENMLLEGGATILKLGEEQQAALLNGFSLFTNLDYMVEGQGLTYNLPRKQGTNNSVLLTFTGVSGTYIPSNSLVSNNDGSINVYTTTSSIIGPTGNCEVYASPTQTTPLDIPQNTLTVLGFTNSGVTGVNNNIAGTQAIQEEDLSFYKTRIRNSLAYGRINYSNYLRELIRNIPTNDSRLCNLKIKMVDVTDAQSNVFTVMQYEVIAYGTNDYATAQAMFDNTVVKIFSSSLPDSDPNKLVINITDGRDTYPITFTRPKQKSIKISITYKTTRSLGASNVSNLSVGDIVNYINSLYVGDSLNLILVQEIFHRSIALAILNLENLLNVDIVVTDSSDNPITPTGDVITVASYEYFQVDASMIEFFEQ